MILRSIGGFSDNILLALEEQFKDEYLYCWNNFKHDTTWAFDAYEKSFKDNKNILCAETPLIGRELFNQQSLNSYFRIGCNNVSNYHDHNFWIPTNPTPDRLFEILENTNTVLKDWRKDGDHIIYAMQVPADTSLTGLDIFAAAQYDLILLRKLTNRPIYISMHPDTKHGWGKSQFNDNKRSYDGFLKVVDLTNSIIADCSTQELFNNAWCTICYTSGSSFDSIANGIPVITLSQLSFMRPLSSISYYDINNPLIIDRLPWLSKIAYCQWTIDEVRSGKFKNYINNL
jgi:hypothetical protein